jgi:hypothetical protein
MSRSHGGKGSSARPIPNRDKFSDNWDAIFGKKNKTKEQKPETNKDEEENK